MDQFLWSWNNEEEENPLGEVLKQEWAACWGIAPTRQLEALYKLSDLDLPADFRLSIQEVLDIMSRKKLEDRRLKKIKELKELLTKYGTVLEHQNPLTYHYAKRKKTVRNHEGRYKAKKVIVHAYEEAKFEANLQELLLASPVAARLTITAEYGNIVGKVPYYSEGEETGGHLLLITGYGVDCNGVRFWEAQDSYGIQKGVNGFIRIRRDMNMISDYFEIEI